MSTMSRYKSVKDITRSIAGKRIQDVDPELVVFIHDKKRSLFAARNDESQKPEEILSAEEQLKGRFKMDMMKSMEYLEKSGWGNGIRLPFANKENTELEKILEVKQRKYLAVHTELRDNVEHLRMLEQNFTQVNDDIDTSHNFLASKKKLVEEERNRLAVAETYHNRVMKDVKTTSRAIKGCKERCEKMKANQERRLANLIELRDLIEFDREALQEYHVRLRQFQNQKLELGRIIEQDQKQVGKIEKTFVELGAKRKELRMLLDQQAMNSSKCQEQLDRLSMEFRKVYKHRQEMLSLWSSNIENARKKDAQMKEVADDYFEIREKIRSLNDELEFRTRQLLKLQCQIYSATLHCNELNTKINDFRRDLRIYRDEYISLNDSVLELLLDIRAISAEEKKLRSRNSKVDDKTKEEYDKFVKMESTVKKLRQKLKSVANMRYHADQNINELEKILNDEEKRCESMHREMELARKHFWERSNDKKMVKHEIHHAELNIQRLKSSMNNLEAKELMHMEFLSKQSSKIYRLDLEYSTLENKLSLAQNDTSNNYYYALQQEMTQMKEAVRKLDAERRYIKKETANVELLILTSGSDLVKQKNQKEKLSTELLETNMGIQRTQKLFEKAEKQMQEMLVAHSLYQVDLKRIGEVIKLTKERNYGLSEEQRTLQSAVNERKMEIETNRMLSVSKSKALMEANCRLRVQIQEMEARTAKLKGRFELVTKLIIGSHPQGAVDDTIGHRVRHAARERESLQMELRKWEARVDEAKVELAGLENVVQLLHASNMAVKDKLTPISEESEEAQELEVLEQEERALNVRKNKAQRFKAILFDKLEDFKQRIAVMEQEKQATLQLSKTKGQVASRVENEIHKQKEKVIRWNTLCCKLLRDIKPLMRSKQDFEILEQTMKLRFIQEKLECAFTMLDRLLAAFPQHKQVLMEFFGNNDHLCPHLHRLLRAAHGDTNFLARQYYAKSTGVRIADNSSSSSSSEKKKLYRKTGHQGSLRYQSIDEIDESPSTSYGYASGTAGSATADDVDDPTSSSTNERAVSFSYDDDDGSNLSQKS